MAMHVNYPHEPGYLHDCPACEASCHCTVGAAECVYDGLHTGTLPAVLQPSEVARLFRVETKTVTRWADSGSLPHFKTLGGHRRFHREDVVAALTVAAR